jgi:hypothetical protein
MRLLTIFPTWPLPAGPSRGGHTWSSAEIEILQRRWIVGTREPLSIDLILYTGLRASDVVRDGSRTERREGWISITQWKG